MNVRESTLEDANVLILDDAAILHKMKFLRCHLDPGLVEAGCSDAAARWERAGGVGRR